MYEISRFVAVYFFWRLNMKSRFITIFSILIVGSSALGAPQSPRDLQLEIQALQQDTNRILNQKAHVLTNDLNFELNGSLKGSLSGSMSGTGGMEQTLKGGILGTILGIGLSTLAPQLSLPLTLGSALSGSAIGSLLKNENLTGKISGNIKGEISAKGWENHYETKSYMAIIIDPSHLQLISKIEGTFRKSNCSKSFGELTKNILASKRFFTIDEFQIVLKNIARINEGLDELALASIASSAADRANIESFLSRIKSWLAKRIQVVGIGTQGLEIQPYAAIEVDFSKSIYTQDIERKYPPFPLASVQISAQTKPENILITSLNKVIFEQLGLKYKQILYIIDSSGRFNFTMLNVTDPQNPSNAFEQVSNDKLTVKVPGFLPFSSKTVEVVPKISVIKIQQLASRDGKNCDSESDLAAVLTETSTVDTILLNSITNETGNEQKRIMVPAKVNQLSTPLK
jgi:hypothetical protein